MATRLPRHGWRTIATVVGYVVAAAAGLAWLSRSGTDPAAVVVLVVVAVVVLVLLLAHTIGRNAAIARRVVGDTTVIVEANPSHRVNAVGAGELRPLVHAVNRLAELHESATRDAADRAEAARRDVESERNRLAALMAQLTVAVIVCNSEGRILLYNAAARSLFGDDTPVGLGRSVFGVVDRGLVAHAEERLASGAEEVYTATTLHDERLIRVRLALVREAFAGGDEAGSGFVLVLEDLTREVSAGDRRARLLRRLVESTRASLGSIRAAAESVLEFPDLDEHERERFLEIVRDESDRLGRQVDEIVTESTGLGDDRGLTEIAGDDLVGVVRNELARAGFDTTVSLESEHLWLRADGHAVARVVVHLADRLRAAAGSGGTRLVLGPDGPHGHLDLCWTGGAVAPADLDRWLDEPLTGASTATARAVLERHGAEVWGAQTDDTTAYLRVLLPLAAGEERRTPQPRTEPAARPEFYDFDLFTTGRDQTPDLLDRRLDEMSFTVFDTETTGLEPMAGDRVISIGAVRVVNGRALRQETFERLVAPGRSVPAASIAIHGITEDMLVGQPPIAEVLPGFARFAEDTVLVGHNVSFDLQFLKLSERDSGVVLSQPALDTLLLHAVVDPEHPDHSLDAIATRLGISVVGRHTALGDALVTAEVFVALTGMLREKGIVTLGQAIAASRETFAARVDERLYGTRS